MNLRITRACLHLRMKFRWLRKGERLLLIINIRDAIWDTMYINIRECILMFNFLECQCYKNSIKQIRSPWILQGWSHLWKVILSNNIVLEIQFRIYFFFFFFFVNLFLLFSSVLRMFYISQCRLLILISYFSLTSIDLEV